jgi:hypothetical protein
MIRMKARAASTNLPRAISQWGLSGCDSKKNRRAMTPSLARKTRQFSALFTFCTSCSVITAANNIPIDWQAIVATIIRARQLLGKTSET